MSADNETYIPKAEMELARLLAQKNYNESVVKKAEARLKQIKKITKNYSDDEQRKPSISNSSRVNMGSIA